MTSFCILVLAPLGLCFSFKFRLDSIYTFGDIDVLRLWHFGWKTPIRANFRRFFGLLTPENYDVIVLTPKGMQLTQKHAF